MGASIKQITNEINLCEDSLEEIQHFLTRFGRFLKLETVADIRAREQVVMQEWKDACAQASSVWIGEPRG